MQKADKTVITETKYILLVSVILSIAMQIVFLAVSRWDYTVLLGNLLSLIIAVGNFYIMGLSVQKAVSKEKEEASRIMRASQMGRQFAMFLLAAVGVLVPCFNSVAVIIPLFFPRIAIALRPVFKKKEVI